MAVKNKTYMDDVLYFCTFSCCKWLPLFELTNTYDAIYKWFDILKQRNTPVVGYVIMPNHLHLILYKSSLEKKNISQIIGTGKRFLAYEIVARLKAQSDIHILNTLASAVSKNDHKRNKKHKVFNTSFDSKVCINHNFISQKLHYIHRNPTSGKWNLAEDFLSYKHSSASYYCSGNQGIYDVVDYRTIAPNI